MHAIDLMSLVSELAHSPVQKFDAIFTSRTMWFGRIINYFQSQKEVDVHSIIYKIQNLIEKDPSVLQQSMFVREIIQLTNKLDAHVCALFESNPHPENRKLLSFVFCLESCVLTGISGDQTKDFEVIQAIKSRLLPKNVMAYLVSTNFSQNITLATVCCSYIEENEIFEKVEKYLIEKPEKTVSLLNAGCLVKNDFVIRQAWKILYQKKRFELFKTDKRMTSALDYLINKKEFSNQILLVGNLQNPQKILVSRELLAQRNKYFQGLFQGNFLEGDLPVIRLKDQDLQSIDYESFLYLLRYIYTGEFDVPLDFCLIVSRLANMYLEPDLKKICDKKKWDQAILTIENKDLKGKFQSVNYEKFFFWVHKTYTGKNDVSSVIKFKDLDIEKLQGIDYKEMLYLLHYIYTSDEDVPLELCPKVSYLADIYAEPDLKKICDKKTGSFHLDR
ncbi:MAG: BTB/POZ domain-containing protein [Candidatus Rhabdochlamydia sp.]